MSLYCPKCWSPAKCTDSRCDPRTNTVRRRHECKDKVCLHRFTSVEVIVGAVDLRSAESSSLVAIAWEIFDQLGGDNADAAFKQAWNDYQAERANRRPAKTKVPKPNKKPSKTHPWRESKIALEKSGPTK